MSHKACGFILFKKMQKRQENNLKVFKFVKLKLYCVNLLKTRVNTVVLVYKVQKVYLCTKQ